MSSLPISATEAEALGVTCVFGGHPESLLERTDLLCVSGGVPLTLPLITDAMLKGYPRNQ